MWLLILIYGSRNQFLAQGHAPYAGLGTTARRWPGSHAARVLPNHLSSVS